MKISTEAALPFSDLNTTMAVETPDDGARKAPSTLSSAETKKYPARLYHETPNWVPAGSIFHIRIRCAKENPKAMTEPELGTALLASAEFYQSRRRWWTRLFLLMPDHLHALLSFPMTESMSTVIGDWKRYHEKTLGVVWQEGYFDHRIRERDQLDLKAAYIRRNPVVAGLCAKPEDWPWVWPKLP